MLEALLSGDSLSRVLLKHLAHEVLGLIRDSVPVGGVKGKWLLEDISEDLLVVITFERRVSTKEDKEDDAETPNIAGLVVVTLEHFWGDIIRCTDDGVHALNFLLLREALGKTKINQFDLGVLGGVVHKEVLRLQVSMDNAVSMQMLDSTDHLAHDIGGVALGEPLSSDDTVKKLSALAVLHNDVDITVIDVALIELDNVGVVNLLENGELFLEKSDILSDVLTEDGLDGPRDLGVRLQRGRSDCSEMTTTDHLNKVVDCADVCCGECLRDVLENTLGISFDHLIKFQILYCKKYFYQSKKATK